MKPKLIRITTIPISLEKLLDGQLSYMSEYYEVIAVSAEEERLLQFGIDNKIRTHFIPLTRQITPVADLRALWRMYRFLRKEKPLIVHSHTPKAGTIGMLAAKLAGVPNRLHTVAGLPLMETTGIKRKVLNFVEKITYSAASEIYPNSNGLKEIILKEEFCKANKLKVIGNGSSNGIDTTLFDPAKFSREDKKKLSLELGISTNEIVFIFVGRLVSDKGINELVTAFTKVQLNHPNCSLLLVGPLEQELDPLYPLTLDTINNNDKIISVGYQDDVKPYFAISNALVFPSYREGFPNVVMQAGAMGLPSIVSNINGCNEIIANKVNGLIIPVKNIDKLEEAMVELVVNGAICSEMAKNARHSIVNRFAQKQVWEAILAEYQSFEEQK